MIDAIILEMALKEHLKREYHDRDGCWPSCAKDIAKRYDELIWDIPESEIIGTYE